MNIHTKYEVLLLSMWAGEQTKEKFYYFDSTEEFIGAVLLLSMWAGEQTKKSTIKSAI